VRAPCIGAARVDGPATTARPAFTGVELQIALEIAHALLDHADTAFDPDTMQHFHRKARRTYRIVMKFIGTVPAADSQRAHIGELLATLEERLGAVTHHSVC